MGEIKSVKVDNWGVFFLQKLQNFFNKTDYCDLTLQFRDNSQLKVHRLVLSACTDYFNVLEQTCEVVDDALIMPNELQADVVVPIVNFMYTGTLEFELKMYGKLLRTAKEMNMTVLLKLLEAHRRTMENVNRAQRPPSPKAIRRRGPVGMQTVTSSPQYQNQSQQTRTGPGGGSLLQRRIVQTKTVGTTIAPGVQVFRQQIGSTSVVRTSALKTNQSTGQTYVKSENDDYETITTTQPTSPFEQLRKGYNNNKRPAVTTFSSPPTKKPNLEDVKEFAEQQRMRKQIAAEYGDDQEFEGMMDDDIHNDDDDDDAAGVGSIGGAPTTQSSSVIGNTVSTERGASITFKHENDGQPPTIIVKDNSGSKLNHAKIISEVLRQYPHLAKGNKNIKLKIMPNTGGQSQRIIVKKESDPPAQSEQLTQQISKQVVQQKVNLPTQLLSSQVTIKAGDRVISQVPQVTISKTVISGTPKPTAPAANVSSPAENSQQKRRIDSKTMHALIALGAENMTGPWLCLRCGVNGRPISIPTYRGFRRHLINTHKETIDPALCEHCGWRSRTNRELHFHLQVEHKIKTTLYTFPECVLCVELFLDTNALNQHMLDSHPSANKQQCIYCNKIFIKEIQLYTHMKLYHKHQALEDGIIDASDEEFSGGLHAEEGEDTDGERMDTDSEHDFNKSPTERKDAKVKILSDISLPIASSIIKLDSDNIKETLDASTIDAQTKFVTADGNEMILTDEQRKEIMSQLDQDQNNGSVVMVLQEAIFPSGEAISTTASTEETSTRDDIISEEELDENQIYADITSSENVTARNKMAKSNSQADGKERLDNLEWAENLISDHDNADAENKASSKMDEENKGKRDDISEKLKELTGDWSEDELEEEDINDEPEKTEKSDAEQTTEAVGERSTADPMEEELPTESEKEAINRADDNSCSSKKSSKDEEDETIVKEVTKSDVKKETKDDIDLAMQSLHEGDIKVEIDLSKERLPSLGEDIKLGVDKVKKEKSVLDESSETNVEEKAAITTTTTITTSDVVSQSTSLLDELMSTTQSAQKDKIIDDFDNAELNDVEEFTTIDKNEQESTNIVISKEPKVTSSETDSKAHDETKVAEKDISSETPVTITKSLSNEWEDIDEVDNDDEDMGMDAVVGNDVD